MKITYSDLALLVTSIIERDNITMLDELIEVLDNAEGSFTITQQEEL